MRLRLYGRAVPAAGYRAVDALVPETNRNGGFFGGFARPGDIWPDREGMDARRASISCPQVARDRDKLRKGLGFVNQAGSPARPCSGMAREGIEPPTRGFSVRCSTN